MKGREQTHYERRRLAVHERILAAALDRFEIQGIGETRIDDICAKAGVAQKTFFNHFPSKQHVVREIAEGFLHAVVETIDEVRRAPGTAGDKIEQLFERTTQRALSAPPMRRSLVVEVIGALHGNRGETELAEALRRSVEGLVRDGVRAGDVTRAHPIPVLARVVAGSFYALMLDWASIDGFPLRARSRAVARFLAEALAQVSPPAKEARARAAGSRPRKRLAGAGRSASG